MAVTTNGNNSPQLMHSGVAYQCYHQHCCVQRSTDICSTKHHTQYMTDCCIHTSDIARRQHLRSAGCHQLFVPRHRRSMFGRRAFSVAGLAAWNSLYQTTC